MGTTVQILVVEDEGIVARDIQHRLKHLGYLVLATASSGEEAVQCAAELRPDLVLMDIVLAGEMDGIQAAEEIRVRYDIPVIYLTAYADEITLQRAKITGPLGYILKPYTERELHAAIEAGLYRHQMDRKLKDSESRYRRIVETSQEGIWTTDTEGKTTFVNARMGEMLGYTVDEMKGARLSAFMDAEGQALATANTERRHTGSAEQHEFKFRRKDGSSLWTWLSASPILQEGQYAGTLAMVTDITEHKQAAEALRRTHDELEIRIQERTVELLTANAALQTEIMERKRVEEALRESEKRYKQLLDSVTDYIYTVQVQDGHPVATVHGPGCTAVTGYTSEDYEADHNLWYRMVDEQDRQAVTEQAIKVLSKEGAPPLEHRLIHRDGSIRWVRNTPVPRYDEHQCLIAYDGLIADITERKQAEEALRESEDRYRTLVTLSPDGIVIHSAGIVLYANEAAAKRVNTPSAELFVGKSVIDFVHPDSRGSVMERTRQISEEGKAVPPLEEKLVGMDGSVINVEIASVALTYQGKPAILSVLRDLTERKQAEEELHQVNRALRTISECNQALVRTTDEFALLNEVCEIIVKVGQYRLTWVGLAEQDEAKTVRPVAQAGYEEGYLETLNITWADTERGRGPTGTAIRTGQPCVSRNIPTDPAFEPWRAEVAKRGYASSIALPLIANERPFGALNIYAEKPDAFHSEEVKLLTELANDLAYGIMALRTRAAHRRAEEEIRLHARRLATLNEIGRAITSTLDLDRVLVTLLEHVLQATDAEAGSVALVEKATGELVFRHAAGEPGQAVVGLRLKPGQGIAGWVATHRQPELVPQAVSDSRFYGHVNFTTRDVACVPLIAHDTVVGVIELLNKREGAFGDIDIQLLESVAAQAAIAIENARLFETERAGRQRLETLYHISQAVNSTLDVDSILDQLTDEAMRATHATHGSALVVRPDLGCFERRSLRGYSPDILEAARVVPLPLDQGLNGRAYRTRQVVCESDVLADPDYYPLVPGTSTELVAPIVRGDQVLGNLDLQSPEANAFRYVDLEFLRALTDQVAVALENARLYQQIRRHAEELETRVADRTRELTEANQRLQKLDRMKDEFVSNVSHELRTPLANVHLYLRLLERGKPDKHDEYMQTLHRETDRLAKMIENLLDLSRLDRDVITINLVPADVGELAGLLATDRSALAADHGLALRYESAPHLPFALADTVMLSQVISNLLTNAIHYTPGGGTITVTTNTGQDRARDWVRVSVRDTGPGISANDLPHLFERFYRGEAGRRSTAPGTGLGLAICREIVERLGGQITVESQPGQGAAFTVWLQSA